MPTKIEKDAVTGTETTGHEWDGIKELNTPLPRWWLYVFYATVIWAIGYFVLYPAIPGLSGHTSGLLGYSSRVEVAEKLASAREAQSQYISQIEATDLEAIPANAELATFARAGGAAAFADNCAPCHAAGGAGQGIYPVLADDAWIWGGTLEDIHTTLLHGIRWNADEDTRLSEMPAYGDFMAAEEIDQVAEYVLSLRQV